MRSHRQDRQPPRAGQVLPPREEPFPGEEQTVGRARRYEPGPLAREPLERLRALDLLDLDEFGGHRANLAMAFRRAGLSRSRAQRHSVSRIMRASEDAS